jgi:hypothetical protein
MLRRLMTVALLIAVVPLIGICRAGGGGNQPTKVKVFLVAADDNGKSGKKIGCDDSLVAVERDVTTTYALLRAALEELLSIPQEFDDKLGNYVFGPDLKLKSASIKRGTATIRFSGAISVAGICDVPRITEQIHGTAKQFRTVKRVKVFVGNKTLAQAIR